MNLKETKVIIVHSKCSLFVPNFKSLSCTYTKVVYNSRLAVMNRSLDDI